MLLTINLFGLNYFYTSFQVHQNNAVSSKKAHAYEFLFVMEFLLIILIHFGY